MTEGKPSQETGPLELRETAKRLGQAFGLQSAANLSMNAVSTLTAEQLAQHYSWRAVFALAALSSLLALLLGAGIPPMRARAGAELEGAAPAYRALWPVFVCSALLGATYVAFATFHQPYALALGTARVSTFFVGFTAAALTLVSNGYALGEGREAEGLVIVAVEPPPGLEGGRSSGLYQGRARSTNIVASSIEAYVEALNAMLAEPHWAGAAENAGRGRRGATPETHGRRGEIDPDANTDLPWVG